MSGRSRAFARFCYDFVVGDHWGVAIGILAAFALTDVVSKTHLPAWWVLPSAVLVLLPLSLWRSARKLRGPADQKTSSPRP